MAVYLSPPPRGPLAQLMAALLGLLAMAGAFIFGLVALAVVAALAAIFGIFAWFSTRKLRKQVREKMQDTPRRDRDDSIEGEYTVISRRRDAP